MGNSNMVPDRQNRRRKYLINPAYQWKQACTIAVIVFLSSSIISFATFGVLHQQARMRLADPSGYHADVTSIILLFAVGSSALTAGGIGLWSILMTHRICGPAFVLDRSMNELREGRFPKMRGLRKKDELQGLYTSTSEAVEALEGRARRELATVADALDLARSAQQASDTVRVTSLQSLASQLEQLRGELAESLQDMDNPVSAKGTEPASACCPSPLAAPKRQPGRASA